MSRSSLAFPNLFISQKNPEIFYRIPISFFSRKHLQARNLVGGESNSVTKLLSRKFICKEVLHTCHFISWERTETFFFPSRDTWNFQQYFKMLMHLFYDFSGSPKRCSAKHLAGKHCCSQYTDYC